MNIKKLVLVAILFSSSPLAFGNDGKKDLCDKNFWKNASLEDLDGIANPNQTCLEQWERVIHLAAKFSSHAVLRLGL